MRLGEKVEARGWAVEFDGVDDYAEAYNHASLNLGDTFEIEAKVRWKNLVGDQTILSKGTGGYQVRSSGSKLQLLKQGTGVIAETASGILVAGDFWHVNVWKNGATVGLAVNLIESTTVISSATIVNTSSSLFIGAKDGTSEFFGGAFQDLRFWTAVRTPAQRLKYATRPVIPEDPNLLSWWPVYEGAGINVANVAV